MPPVAQGTLANTPFAHLVLYIYQRRSSGTLVVHGTGAAAGDPVKVLFHRGRAVAARVPGSHEALDSALLPLCARRDGKYEFFEDDLVGSGAGIVTGMFDPYAFVTEAARRHAPDSVIDEVLERFAETPLCVQPGMDLDRLLLRPQEAKFAEILRDGTATIGTLMHSRDLNENQARRVLYALLVTKVVGPFAPTADEVKSAPPQGAPSGLPKGKSSDAPARASGLTPDERRRQSGAAWAAIAARASQASRPLSGPLGTPRSPTPARSFTPAPGARSVTPAPGARSVTPPPGAARPSPAPRKATPTPTAAVRVGSQRPQTPPGAFGVRRTPPPPEQPSAPPGRVVEPPLEGQRPVSGLVNQQPRVTTPSRPISRVTPRPNSEPVEELDAAGKLRRVQQLCQRNAFDEALPIIRALVEEERRNPAYLGMLALVLYGHGTEGTISKEIVDTVNQALRIHPDEINALYTKARCYKRMGKMREALHYFRRTVAVDPAHLEAAREVRLLLLRQNDKTKR